MMRVCQESIASYPRYYLGYHMLGVIYAAEGQYERAAESGQQAIQLASYRGNLYVTQANYLLGLQRLDDARREIEEAQRRKWDGFLVHAQLYALAFLERNSPKMAEQSQWFSDHPDVKHFWPFPGGRY